MTEAECIDCGQWSETLLPARFPHICSACLFPPRNVKDENRTDEMPDLMRHNSRGILADLYTALPKPGPSWSGQL